MPWYASLTSLPATLSPPPSFIPMCWLLFRCQPPNTLWLRFDTIYANSEPRTWSKNSQNRAAINSVQQGYSICLVFLKLFERVYSPLTAGLLQPYRPDSKLRDHKRTQLDRLYQKIVDDLDQLLDAVGLKAA